jgi:hypothetical protein
MRLEVLNSGHGLKARALLSFVKLVSKRPPPDVMKLLLYRSEFLGKQLNPLFQAALRGPSQWSVGDRELMAAFVSKKNECEF